MSSQSKVETQIVAATIIGQTVLMLTVGGFAAVILPPLLAALPAALTTMKSEQTVRMMAPKLGRAYSGIAMLAAGVAAFFILANDDLSWKLQFVRALLLDATVLWAASAVAVQIQLSRPKKSRSAT